MTQIQVNLAETYATYRSRIRSAARGLWVGALDYDQFYDDLWAITIPGGITAAWYEGAAECGILPSELTAEEKQAMGTFIWQQQQHIDSFATFIMDNSKARGGKLSHVMGRVETWANRYNEAKHLAMGMACGDQKLVWQLGPTKVHCGTCLKMNGKVKRASQWDRAGVRPQSPELECGGWRCLCTLNPTDAPMSMGPLPRMP